MKDQGHTTGSGYCMDELFDISTSKRLSDLDNYLLSWLTASPEKMRCCRVDADMRLEMVLTVLHKEMTATVIPFRKIRQTR